MFTEADREGVLGRAVSLMTGDPRIEAIVLTGSLGRGHEDRWSDIDLGAVITNADDVEAVTAEWEALAYREWPVVHHYATEFGTTRVRGFLLRDGLLLDLGFTPIGDFEAWAPLEMLLDRTGRATKVAEGWAAWSPTPDWRGEAGFAMHDVLHACVAANRGRLWQSLYYLQRVRNRTLSLASERHGFDAEEFTHVDDLPATETSPLQATLISDLGRETLLEAIELAARAFLEELGRHDQELSDRLAEPLLLIVAASKACVADLGAAEASAQ